LVDVDAITQAVLVIELVYLLDHMLGILFVWLILRLAQQVHVVLLLACQLPLLIGTQALSFGVLHVRDLIEKLMIGVLLLLHDVIDVLRMELLGIERSHLLVKCHAIGQSLMIRLHIMVLYVKSLAFTFRQLIELVFAHLI